MIPTGDREHPDEIKRDGNGYSGPTGTDPDDAQAHRMDGNNRNTTEPVHLGDSIRFHMFEAGPRIKPPQKGKPEVLSLGRKERSHVGHSGTSSQAPGNTARAHTIT